MLDWWSRILIYYRNKKKKNAREQSKKEKCYRVNGDKLKIYTAKAHNCTINVLISKCSCVISKW